MSESGFDLSILGAAFLAGLLVIATHVPLGAQVLARGIVFIDLAIAQLAGLGVIAARVTGWATQEWHVQLAAVGAALLGALVLSYSDKHWPQLQEPLIGVLFVLAASGGMLLLAHDPHGAEQLKELLNGQILWVNYTQLIPVALMSALILIFWFTLGKRIGGLGFYILFACAATVSVQLVGVYLVFASLILPALAMRRYAEKWRLWAGYAVGGTGYAAGLLGSALFDLPSGAAIVWMLALASLAGLGLSYLQQNQ